MMTSAQTREALHPLWTHLSASAEAARALFRAGGSEARFRDKLASLGFDGPGIAIEIEQNRPPSW